VLDLGKVLDMFTTQSIDTGDGDACRLRTGVDLQLERLRCSANPRLEPDGEGVAPVDDRFSAIEQQACPLLRAWHQGMLVPVHYENRHLNSSFFFVAPLRAR
jgi:hypothetical protein